MTVLDQLEQVTADEHEALVRGDWRALEVCVEHKQVLAEQLDEVSPSQASTAQARRLSAATRHNLELASRLSRQLGELFTTRERRPTYNQCGRLGPRPLAVVSLTC